MYVYIYIYIYIFDLITFCVITIVIILIFTIFFLVLSIVLAQVLFHVSRILKLHVNFSKFWFVSRFNLYVIACINSTELTNEFTTEDHCWTIETSLILNLKLLSIAKNIVVQVTEKKNCNPYFVFTKLKDCLQHALHNFFLMLPIRASTSLFIYTLWCHVMPCGALWCHGMPCGTVWCLVVLCDAVWGLVMLFEVL